MSCERPNARGHYFAPTYRQAKSIAWDYLREFTAHVPGMVFNKTESPTKFVYKDHFVQLMIVFWIISFVLIIYYK